MLWRGSTDFIAAGRKAVFRRGAGFVAFPVELLRGQLEHCFAMTVHKGQGSEFDRVALVLPEQITVFRASEAFDEMDDLKEERAAATLKRVAQRLVDAAREMA